MAHPGGLLLAFTRGNELASDLWIWRDGAELQVTRVRGMEAEPTLSPDGKLLAFSRIPARHDFGPYDILVLDLATGIETVRDAGWSPRWSPDGQWLAIAHDDGIALHGASGEPRRVSSAIRRSGGVHWSTSGRLLAARSANAIVVFEASTGKLLARIDGSPDQTQSLYNFSLGETLVSMVSGNAPHQWDAYVAPIEAGPARKLTGQTFRDGVTALSPLQERVFSLQSQGEDCAAFMLDVADGTMREVHASAEPRLEPTWSPDGRFVVFVTADHTIQLLHAQSGRSRALAKMQPSPTRRRCAPAVWFGNGRELPAVRAAK